jgi:hypothetical protein
MYEIHRGLIFVRVTWLVLTPQSILPDTSNRVTASSQLKISVVIGMRAPIAPPTTPPSINGVEKPAE